MQTISIGNRQWLFVEVPKGSFNCWVKCGVAIRQLLCSVPTDKPMRITTNVEWLPMINNYIFLCTTDTITEDIAKGIVEWGFCSSNGTVLFKNYEDNEKCYKSWIGSFKSLLLANNLDPQKTYAILLKELK